MERKNKRIDSRNSFPLLKRGLCLALALLCIVSTLFPVVVSAEVDDTKDKKAVLDAAKDTPELDSVESAASWVGAMGDFSTLPTPDDYGAQAIRYVVYRLLRPGYIYDVREAVVSNNANSDLLYESPEGLVACHSSELGDFLYHNCSVPNIMSEILQNFNDKDWLVNAGKVSSQSTFGVPSEVEDLPLVPTERQTGLEMFGYNLPVVGYKGEFDAIQTSFQTRMLANFSGWDKVRTLGMTIWNSIKGGAIGLVRGIDWNPIKWFGNIFSSSASHGILSIMDTSDANVIAKSAWTRPDFGHTVYGNVFRMTAEQTAQRTSVISAEIYANLLEEELRKDPTYNSWIAASTARNGTLVVERKCTNQDRITAAVKDLRDWTQCMSELGARCGEKPVIPVCEGRTPEEIFKDWVDAEDTKPITIEGLSQFDPLHKGYNKMVDDGITNWEQYQEAYRKGIESVKDQIFLVNSKKFKDIEKEVTAKFSSDYPIYNISNEASRWLFVEDIEGKTVEEILQDGENLFVQVEDSKNVIFNSDAGFDSSKRPSQLRQPPQGGLYGTGDRQPSKDGRVILYRMYSMQNSSPDVLGGLAETIRVFFIKLTNTVLSLSFTNIIEGFGLDDLAEDLLASMRDGIWLVLASLIIALSGIFYMMKIFSSGSTSELLMSMGWILLIFVVTTAILLVPGKALRALDKIPNIMDTIIADSLSGEIDSDDPLCSGVSGERSLLCEVWRVGIYMPWMSQQWGTADVHALDDDEISLSSDVRTLVGRPSVYMGPGYNYDNWALYQLQLTTSGNLTTKDPDFKSGVVDNNLYRIVDWQLGPNNNEGRDSRFAYDWSGFTRGNASTFWGMLAGLFMLICFGRFAIYKIELSFRMVFNLLIFPIVGILSVAPNGKAKWIDWWVTMINLTIKRCLVVLFILIPITIMRLGFAQTGQDYSSIALITIGIMLAMLLWWKAFLKIFDFAPSGGSSAGGFMSAEPLTKERVNELKQSAGKSIGKFVPKAVQQNISQRKAQAIEGAGGAIGAGLAAAGSKVRGNDVSIREMMADGARRGSGRVGQMMSRQYRREGRGALGDALSAVDEMDVHLAQEINRGGKTADAEAIRRGYKNLQLESNVILSTEEMMSEHLGKVVRDYSSSKEELDKLEIILRDNINKLSNKEVVKYTKKYKAALEENTIAIQKFIEYRNSSLRKDSEVEMGSVNARKMDRSMKESNRSLKTRKAKAALAQEMKDKSITARGLEERFNNIVESNNKKVNDDFLRTATEEEMRVFEATGEMPQRFQKKINEKVNLSEELKERSEKLEKESQQEEQEAQEAQEEQEAQETQETTED